MADDLIKAAAVSPWLTQDKAYQAHHFACWVCISAGKGLGQRCAAGAVLWRGYLEAFDSVYGSGEVCDPGVV